MKVSGTVCAIIEIGLFYMTANFVRGYGILNIIDPVAYYWLTFTVLTGIWESVYISDRRTPSLEARKLIKEKRHVWTSNYDLTMILPWKLSRQFYAEYGAWADREYMNLTDDWSKIVEGSHGMICGLFSFIGLFHLLATNATHIYYVSISISMGSQFMNSVLYMAQYGIQTENSDSVNYNTTQFPTGRFLSKRPFMWINYAWLIMPCYVLTTLW